ncbi:MAG: hypothetical protein HC924_15470 [Synechococcaceae cyanobacterium SM2_3_2]|nr:hypothetical protein [Synechococcaceae cyanobacterium SM2_3_2]
MRTPPLHHLPPLEAVVSQHISPAGGLINGDVQMDPTAQIGPGVLLQADPGCQIRVGAGACIGMGSIIHAHGGSLIIGQGVTLGVGVLVVGAGTIGANACVGSYSTVMDCYVEPQMIIPPGSLMGDESREAAMTGIPEAGVDKPSVAPSIPVGPGQLSSLEPPGTHRLPNNPNANVQESLAAWHQAQSQSSPSPQPVPPKTVKPNGIPGQADLDRLLNRIVPHRLGNTAE